MFSLGQILNVRQLVRHFHQILRELESEPQPILITQRNGRHMVLVNAEIFEDLMLRKLGEDGIDASPSRVKSRIEMSPKAS